LRAVCRQDHPAHRRRGVADQEGEQAGASDPVGEPVGFLQYRVVSRMVVPTATRSSICCHRSTASADPGRCPESGCSNVVARPTRCSAGNSSNAGARIYVGPRPRCWPDQPRVRRSVRPAAPDHPGRNTRGSPRRGQQAPSRRATLVLQKPSAAITSRAVREWLQVCIGCHAVALGPRRRWTRPSGGLTRASPPRVTARAPASVDLAEQVNAVTGIR